MMKNNRSATLTDGVADTLLEYIGTSGLHPGDLLPREEDLAGKLRVSRHIVREGVGRLKTLGLIESRKRKGMILCHPNAFVGVSKLAEANLFSEEERRDFMGLRVVMELGMTDFIYARKNAEQIARLRALAGDAEESRYSNEAELNFHGQLFSIGGNSMATQFQRLLATVFSAKFHCQVVSPVKTPAHSEICDVLEKGSCEAFHQIMKDHLSQYIDNL